MLTTFGVKLDKFARSRYCEEFAKLEMQSDSINSSDIEYLLQQLGITVDPEELQTIVREQMFKSSVNILDDDEDMFSFKMFVKVVCKVLSSRAVAGDDTSLSMYARLRRRFPLRPDGPFKQSWDIFCLLILVYCSFYVPFNLAFESTAPGITSPTDITELAINIVFMFDIGLSFLTSYHDTQGFLVKDMRDIAANYLRGWFLPDLAGSFPFDTVIAAILSADTQGQSENLGAMKIVRMLKLTRVVRFINRLNKMKESADFSVLGPVISLVSSLLLLIFVAHLLGCCYFMFIWIEPGHNWMESYHPALLDGPLLDRYGALSDRRTGLKCDGMLSTSRNKRIFFHLSVTWFVPISLYSPPSNSPPQPQTLTTYGSAYLQGSR